MSKRYDVCAAVVSDLAYDARVWKEVGSLAAAGHRVKLIGCAYELPRPRRRRSEEIDVFEVPLGSRAGRPSVAGRFLTLLRVWRELLTTSARVYHAHNIHTVPAAWAASRLRRARLVYDAHELRGESGRASLLERILYAVERFAVRRSDVLITTNPSRADTLQNRYGTERATVLANVPRRVDELVPLDPGFPTGLPVVLYQGGIYLGSRAFRETIAAIADLDVHLVLIGFGRHEDLDRIRGWAVENGVSNRVHLLPPRPFAELVRTAAAASVGIVPVRGITPSDFLGDTNKLFEYLMAGLPVAASDLPEIRAVVAQGDPPVGELFDPRSPRSIADAIGRVLDDDAVYRRRREEARRLALERFNWEREEPKLLALYDKMPA